MRSSPLPLMFALLATSAVAKADHDHAHMHDDDGASGGAMPEAPSVRLTGTFGLSAASFSNMLYVGDYEGARVGLAAARGPFELGVELAAYRLRKNGLLRHGLGDLATRASWTAIETRGASLGIMAMAGFPTGSATDGFGMGHVMMMGHAFGTLTAGRTTFVGAFGYARSLGGGAAHAKHGGGSWPLVDPMTASEIVASISIERVLSRAFFAGVGVSYAEPLDIGDRRAIVDAGVGWRRGRYTTRGLFQAGIAGEPFDLRGSMTVSAGF